LVLITINYGTAIGKNKKVPLIFKENEMVNGHTVLVGGSGTGKTHRLRKIINQISQNNVRVHVFDVHDDIASPLNKESSCIFSESTEDGINPLVVNPDIHAGGVRKAINSFINIINRSGRQLGERQEAVLRVLLEDLYASNGYYIDSPESWKTEGMFKGRKKSSPNLKDLYNWTNYKYKQFFIGGNHKTIQALNNVNAKAFQIQKRIKENVGRKKEDELLELGDLKDEAIIAYSEYLESIKTGKEFEEFIKYDSKATLKSVLDRITNLKNSGVFKNNQIKLDPNKPIWRYRIKNLSQEEKKMFVWFRLQEIYYDALARGESDHIVEVIVIDECSIFMDKEDDNIINVLANEIRKFGVMLVLSSQNFVHFTDDFLGSVGTKIILGIDEMYWEKTARQLQIDKKFLQWIKPRRTFILQMKRIVENGDLLSLVSVNNWLFVKSD
jgi:hypothetical protein